jgi:hypothetical protein
VVDSWHWALLMLFLGVLGLPTTSLAPEELKYQACSG